MRLAWATDIHLNFLEGAELDAFCESVTAAQPDALLVTGDIAEAPSVDFYLGELLRQIERPIYFVLGNHDYYHGRIDVVRARVRALCASETRLTYLDGTQRIKLAPGVVLVGHEGWGDARFGDFERSRVALNDELLIEDLRGLERDARRTRLAALGDEAAAHLGHALDALHADDRIVFVATHVPPFREACWHDGRPSDDAWLPFFACKATGDVLRARAEADAERTYRVLCGHTHGEGTARIRANLEVIAGGAEYGAPVVQRVFEIG